jgi:tetratricopeptide (TPR) repeat protein
LKKPIILFVGTLLLTLAIYTFTNTVKHKKQPANLEGLASNDTTQAFDIQGYISKKKAELTTLQISKVIKLEEEANIKSPENQQIKALNSLGNYWKDSIKSFAAYAYYISNAAKLENSEKNLTFAARYLLASLRGESDAGLLSWKTSEAIALFEKAIAINPGNDSLRIDLGSAYIYGTANTGNPQQTMKGIQEILAVVRKDSSNMRAQLMLGIGGVVSGQFQKATERLLKVAEKEPTNVEAVAYLADAYAGMGNKPEAIKWYNVSKRLINDVHYSQEVDERIKNLK